MLYHVDGIVLRTMDFKESDKIVTLFTRDQGKVAFVAKGVRKVKSKYGAACQLFTHGEFSFYMNQQLGTLRHAEITHSFHELRADLDRAAYAAYLNELIDWMTPEKTPDEALFESYVRALDAIESGLHAAIVLHIFELKMLQETGYAPQLQQCVVCRADKGKFVLSAKAGGVVCANCTHADPTAKPLAENIRRLLFTLQQIEVQQLGDVNLSEETRLVLFRSLRYFIDYHIEHRWKSRTFLDQWLSLS